MKWWTKVRGFGAETVTELRKVTWPDRKEMRRSIVVVLVGMLLLGIFVSLSDFALYEVVDLLSTWVRGKLGS
ncbi:MAG: preprotein translocase subunit SecE [Puniceicoccales bacterium]|jgi:preprotein translocase subunit SecE|nr:preprotein translocase subunit SecE [Puniceicoccales bacterium]